MIDSKALSNGGIRIEINGAGEDMPAAIASAFISNLLHKMQQQAAKLGDNTPEGGAVVYPDSVGVEKDRATGEPRLRLGFGKALFVVSMLPGAMKDVAKIIESI